MYEYSSCALNENQRKHYPALDLILANVGVFFTMVSTAEPVKKSCPLQAGLLGFVLEGNLVVLEPHPPHCSHSTLLCHRLLISHLLTF